jgi:hypothetical protein
MKSTGKLPAAPGADFQRHDKDDADATVDAASPTTGVEGYTEHAAAVYRTLPESTKAIPWKIDWATMEFAYLSRVRQRLQLHRGGETGRGIAGFARCVGSGRDGRHNACNRRRWP